MKIRTASVALALFLASCGGDDSSPGGGPVAGPTPAPAPSPSPSPSPTPSPTATPVPTGYLPFDQLDQDRQFPAGCFAFQKERGEAFLLGDAFPLSTRNSFAFDGQNQSWTNVIPTSFRPTSFGPNELVARDEFLLSYQRISTADPADPQTFVIARPDTGFEYVRSARANIDPSAEIRQNFECVLGVPTLEEDLPSGTGLEALQFSLKGQYLEDGGAMASQTRLVVATATIAETTTLDRLEITLSYTKRSADGSRDRRTVEGSLSALDPNNGMTTLFGNLTGEGPTVQVLLSYFGPDAKEIALVFAADTRFQQASSMFGAEDEVLSGSGFARRP